MCSSDLLVGEAQQDRRIMPGEPGEQGAGVVFRRACRHPAFHQKLLRDGLRFQRQHREIIGEPPPGSYGIEPRGQHGILGGDASRIATLVPVVVTDQEIGRASCRERV